MRTFYSYSRVHILVLISSCINVTYPNKSLSELSSRESEVYFLELRNYAGYLFHKFISTRYLSKKRNSKCYREYKQLAKFNQVDKNEIWLIILKGMLEWWNYWYLHYSRIKVSKLTEKKFFYRIEVDKIKKWSSWLNAKIEKELKTYIFQLVKLPPDRRFFDTKVL